VFIVHQDKVLIRLHDKYKIWTCPGWHIELDENPNQWAIREAKEETGLDVILYNAHQRYHATTDNQTELIPPLYMNIHRIGQTNHQHIGMVYFAYSESADVNPWHASDASHDRRWMSYHDVQNATDMSPHVQHYACAAIHAYQNPPVG
jgi:ADP-ribose pyrophosphatase YjhB (NUDIX family)